MLPRVAAEGLAEYAGACVNVPCTTARFQAAMAAAAGEDLSWFFDRHVYATTDAQISIRFTETATGATIALAQEQPITHALELWLELEGGARERARVRFEGTELELEVATARIAPMRIIRPSKRSSGGTPLTDSQIEKLWGSWPAQAPMTAENDHAGWQRIPISPPMDTTRPSVSCSRMTADSSAARV